MKTPTPKTKPTNNPFTEDDDEKPQKVSEEGIERVQTKDENPHEKEVSVEPDEDEESGPSRVERRRERKEKYDEMERRAQAAEDRARQAEQLAAAVRAQHMVQPREQEKRADPLDEEEKQLQAERMGMLKLADQLNSSKTQLPPEQVQEWREKYLGIEAKQRAVAMKRAVRDAGGGGMSPQAAQQQAQIAMLQAEFPDVTAENRYLAYADGVMKQRLAKENRSNITMADYKYAMEETRKAFRLAGHQSPAPTEELRRKFSGQPIGGGGSNGNRGERTITMNKAQMKMAEAQFRVERDAKTGKTRRLSAPESHAKWAKTVGKKVLDSAH